MNQTINFSKFSKIPCFHALIAAELFLSAGCSNTDNQTNSEKDPNIILVMIDNVGYPEIGINGNELVRTPNLDNFAREGIQFSRFYSNPMSAPTRASLMTGRYHYRTGVIHTSRGGAKMHGDELTIAELLKDEGYTTGIFGKWHLGDNYPMRPQDQGFDELLTHKSGRLGQVPDPDSYINPKLWENGQYVQKKGYCTDLFFDAAINFIEKQQDDPFFIYLPTNIAHASTEVGLEVPEKYSAPYLANGLNKRIATVCGMLDNLDENFGHLIGVLDSLDLRENTLVIFLSDDGNVRINPGSFRGRGYSIPYEGAIKVPCFIQWPDNFQGGSKIDRIASHIDIFPTLLDISGAGKPSDLTIDGLSLLPLLEREEGEWADRMLFMQCSRGMTPHRYQNCAVISQRFKMLGYTNSFEDRNLEVLRDKTGLELYDLSTDPGETNNIADQYPEELEKLKIAYDKWFDDVKNTRQFYPGVIFIGSEEEKSTYLNRYQDASYIDKKPTGWPVKIIRQGEYEISINRGESLGKGKLCIQYDSVYVEKPLQEGENLAIFTLPEAEVKLSVWVEEDGKKYVPRPEEDLIGDVRIRFIQIN
jgi:arylsulfatase A